MTVAYPIPSTAAAFLYPRVISIHRPKVQAVASGPPVATLRPYTGETRDTTSATGEDVIFTRLPAAIQFSSQLSRRAGSTLPSDTHSPGLWKILIPAAAAGIGTIQNRDIVIDDQGGRYQVEDSYWTAFGYNLRARLLEL